MFEGLYVVETPYMWQLRIEDSHYCISAKSSLGEIEECIKQVVRTYKSESRLMRKLSTMEDGGRIGTIEFDRQSSIYRKRGHLHRDFVRVAVKEALKDVVLDTPVMRTKKLFKKVNLDLPTTPLVTNEPPPRSTEQRPTPVLTTKKLVTIKRLSI